MGEIEIFYQNNSEIDAIDKICAENASIDIEVMDVNHISIIIETEKEQVCFALHLDSEKTIDDDGEEIYPIKLIKL